MFSMDPDWGRPGAAPRRGLARAVQDYSRAASELLLAFGLALSLVGIAAGLLVAVGWL